MLSIENHCLREKWGPPEALSGEIRWSPHHTMDKGELVLEEAEDRLLFWSLWVLPFFPWGNSAFFPLELLSFPRSSSCSPVLTLSSDFEQLTVCVCVNLVSTYSKRQMTPSALSAKETSKRA